MQLQKSNKVELLNYEIRGPLSDEAELMEEQGIPVCKLNTGNPGLFGFEPPAYITRDLTAGLSQSVAYSTSKGVKEAREAIYTYSKNRGIPNVEMEHIYTGNGVSELIMLSMQTLLNTGDEILIPTPDYPLWTASAILAGGRVVHYRCDEQSDWLPDIADIKSKVSARTKAIVIINPNNPTGAVYPKEVLEQMVEIAREHELMLFSDEIYDRLVMDGIEHIPTASLAPDLPVVTFNGLSKSHQICGYRCGWMVISGDKSGAGGYIEGIGKMTSMRLCSNVPAQMVIKSALEDESYTQSLLVPGGRLYEQRNIAYQMLNDIPGISAVKPKAALYIFPKIDLDKIKIGDDKRFVLELLRQKHILLTHGQSYNWMEPNHFRMVYLPEEKELVNVMHRIGDFIAHYSTGTGRLAAK